MFRLFSSDQGAQIYSTNNSLKETLPGGPAPDSALPWHNEPINRQLDMENSSASHPHGYTLSDAHRENGPAVADADGAGREGSVGGEAKHLASVASRRTDRSRAIGRASGDDAFAYGAATAVNDTVDPSPQWRVVGAEEDLGRREKPAISKGQHGIGRKLSKIIKNESKADQATLDVAVKELEGFQKLQKASIKEEALSHSRHSRALSDAQKAEMQLLAARIAHERGQANQRATGHALEESRKHVRETTEMLHEKMEDVERLQIQKQADDRERAVKVKSLVGEERKLFGKILRS